MDFWLIFGQKRIKNRYQKGIDFWAENWTGKSQSKIDANSMLGKVMQKNMQSASTWSQNESKHRGRVNKKRGPKIDTKKGPHAQTRLEGRRLGRAARLLD